jgi:hypothetical protein
MKLPGLSKSAMIVLLLSLVGGNEFGETRAGSKPIPPGVVELTGISADGGIVELKDGSLMHAYGGGIYDSGQKGPVYKISKDGGRTWTAPQPLNSEIGVGGMIRLQSGRLAIYGRKNGKDTSPWNYYFGTSTDEGKTWSSGILISNYPDYYPMYHSMIQLQSGRLLLSGGTQIAGGDPPDARRFTATGWGLWHGKLLFMEGERSVAMGFCITYYSDDEGKTWKQSDGIILGWFDDHGVPNGHGGIIDLYEPATAEAKDGQLLLLARSKTGRLVQSYSLDSGKSWYSALPTDLASSQSPAMVVRLPQSGDLLCIWNQVSNAEILRGLLRGRLSVAISRDSGLTWENFKNLELEAGLEDVGHITPDFPIPRRIVGNSPFGQLPEGFMMFTYPNVEVIGDKVFVRYLRMWPIVKKEAPGQAGVGQLPTTVTSEDSKAGAEMKGEGVLRIYPLEWFYK